MQPPRRPDRPDHDPGSGAGSRTRRNRSRRRARSASSNASSRPSVNAPTTSATAQVIGGHLVVQVLHDHDHEAGRAPDADPKIICAGGSPHPTAPFLELAGNHRQRIVRRAGAPYNVDHTANIGRIGSVRLFILTLRPHRSLERGWCPSPHRRTPKRAAPGRPLTPHVQAWCAVRGSNGGQTILVAFPADLETTGGPGIRGLQLL